MATASSGRESRDERISLRATAREHQLIESAARAAGKTLTAFVLDAASTEAQRALADRTEFALDAPSWARFVQALDRPAVAKPRLRRLLRDGDGTGGERAGRGAGQA